MSGHLPKQLKLSWICFKSFGNQYHCTYGKCEQPWPTSSLPLSLFWSEEGETVSNP